MDDIKVKKETEVVADIPATPNRDAYKAAFAEDYPDVDFEDKEARYGAMMNDRSRLRNYREAGKKLTDTFSKNRWIASMLMDLSENPDKDPITWMADNGIDITQAMEDDEYRKTIADKIAKFQENQIAGEELMAQQDANLSATLDNIEALAQEVGLTDDEVQELWRYMYEDVITPALRGEISKDVWKFALNGMRHDTDVDAAREQGAMQARNEKVTNNLKKFDKKVPPTLAQGGAQKTQPKEKPESFWDDLRDL